MNGQQRAVLWIGLILIGLNLVKHWSDISSVIFSGAGIGAGIGSSSNSNSSGGIISLIPGAIGSALHDLPGGMFLSSPVHNTKKTNVQVM
jgi:hypothetical protein